VINFKSFLKEEQTPQNGNTSKDIDHMHLHDGHQGALNSANLLDSLNKHFLGKNSSVKMMMKYNGEPVSFGRDKKGNFFVGSDPSVPNYSHDDIERNHQGYGHTINKLKQAYDHLSKITPENPGMYDGKMFTKDQIKGYKGKQNIEAADRTYSVPMNSGTGKSLKSSQVAISLESMHNGKEFEPLDDKTKSKFNKHPDVHTIDPEVKINPKNYTPEDQREFLNHKREAEITYGKIKPEAFDEMGNHGKKFSAHIDDMSSKGLEPSVDSYLDSLKKNKEHSSMAETVLRNRNHFEKALEFQTHLKNAKNALMNPLHKNSEFSHSVNGVETEPEGAFVKLNKGESKGISAKLRRTP
jgi:hypothetical protein